MKFLILCIYCLFCLVCVFVILTRNLIYGADCNGSVAYMKRSNFAPANVDLVLLYNSTEPGITEECFNRCANSTNDCQAFLVDYDASSCFRINTTTADNNTIVRENNKAVTSASHVNFFQKICLEVPLVSDCRGKLWAFEVAVGSHLVGHTQKAVFGITDHVVCAQLCLYETGFPCRSANYYRGSTPGLPGTCVLSGEDRRSKPDAYSPTPEDVVYLENQCAPPVGDACAMNEYKNNYLPSYVDVYKPGLSMQQCEALCLGQSSFNCRSFSFLPPGVASDVFPNSNTVPDDGTFSTNNSSAPEVSTNSNSASDVSTNSNSASEVSTNGNSVSVVSTNSNSASEVSTNSNTVPATFTTNSNSASDDSTNNNLGGSDMGTVSTNPNEESNSGTISTNNNEVSDAGTFSTNNNEVSDAGTFSTNNNEVSNSGSGSTNGNEASDVRTVFANSNAVSRVSSTNRNTVSRQAANGVSRCALHSEDTTSLGPDAILFRQGATYKERAACLNLLVACSGTVMNITLRTREPFFGRLYASGFSDTCNTDGSGSNVTSLSLPVEAGLPSQQCGVRVVRNIGNTTMSRVASATVVVQYNAIIQRLGDRVVNVNCLIDDTKPPDFQLEKNVTFVGNNTEFGNVNVSVNASRVIPRVRIHIVDLSTGNMDTNQTVVGKPLQLRLDPDTTQGDFDFTVNNLLATNADGSASFLLLDSRGCPANPQFFPALFRDDVTRSYVADFSAFKFPNSRVVRFQLQIQYCPDQCEQAVCNNAAGRQRRHDVRQSEDATSPAGNQSQRFSAATRARADTSGGETVATNRSALVPLEFALVVLPDPANVEPHILARTVADDVIEDAVVIDLPNIIRINADEYLCMPYLTSLGVLMGWIVLQFLVFFACACFVRWQLRRQDDELRKKLIDDFGAFDNYNKRVRWADNVEAIAL